jgi:sarcosine oxidase, subunit gamma
MSDPVMQSPLHAFGLAAQAKAIDAGKGVWANEIVLLGYISLRGDSADAAFATAASQVLGGNLPTSPCTFSQFGAVKVLWLSPDEWMIVCPGARLQKLLTSLKAALASTRHQVVDNSGGYTQVLLRGTNATDVLHHATVYDVASLSVGRIVGTTFGKSSLYMHRYDDGYCLLLRRSFADYIWRYLVRAAEPYGLGVATLPVDNM